MRPSRAVLVHLVVPLRQAAEQQLSLRVRRSSISRAAAQLPAVAMIVGLAVALVGSAIGTAHDLTKDMELVLQHAVAGAHA